MKKIILLFVALTAMVGCKTSHSLTEERDIRDSVNIKDSVRIKDSTRIVTNIKDSVRIKDSTVIVKDEHGNIKSKESWHNMEHFREKTDSTQIYKAMLREALSQRDQAMKEQKTEKVVVEKPHTLWESVREWLAGALIGFVAGVVLISIRRSRKAQ